MSYQQPNSSRLENTTFLITGAHGFIGAWIVKLIEDYGVQIILDALEGGVPEDQADVVVSTAHKAKGREWPTERPPRPLPAREARFPPYSTRSLSNGLQVIAVSHHEQPVIWAAWRLPDTLGE